MKPYTVSIEIDLPREKVVALHQDRDNQFKWQTGLVAIDALSGRHGEPGAKTKLVYKNGKRVIELIETIVEKKLPDEITGHYEWSGGENTLVDRFAEVTQNSTRWESTCTYRFRSTLLRLMGRFFPNVFRKQNQAYLENFKAFAERGQDVRLQS